MKNYETFISPQELLANLDHPDLAIFDCCFDLENPFAAKEAYPEAHRPRAQYIHLEDDLCSPYEHGKSHQHPFPQPEVFIKKLSSLGFDRDVQVVAYEDFLNGFAARLWQMLRWLGHDRVAMLDGGWSGWNESSFPFNEGSGTLAARSFKAAISPDRVLYTQEAFTLWWKGGDSVFIDTRTPERFTRQKYPQSPLSGHIPSTDQFFLFDHFSEGGLLKPKDTLRAQFRVILQGQSGNQAILYCSTGATASVNFAVIKHLGLGEPVLYTSSWEGWRLQPDPAVDKERSGHPKEGN
jgi:thiosulfate/3-mercaptopyruvate sulfurtransferase